MNLGEIKQTVRSYARDFNGSIFREEDITLFANEAIDRIVQVLPQISNMPYLIDDTDFPGHLPIAYHQLLGIYSVSRLYAQDERHYESTNYMNEFETKLAEMLNKVDNGDLVLKDPDSGVDIMAGTNTIDYVVDDYFLPYRKVEGVDY